MLTFVNAENNSVAVPSLVDETTTVFAVYSTWDAFLNGEAAVSTQRFNGQHNYNAAETFFAGWAKVCRDDENWSVVECGPAPTPTVPDTISARQIRLWLISAGISLAQIETLINNIEDQQQREYTRVEWEYAPYIERNHPMVATFAGALGLTDAQVDAGFIVAATL